MVSVWKDTLKKETGSPFVCECGELTGRHKTDVLIIGGGMAGVAAAMACGKRGYRVLLIEALW